jgi:hypothetical protein
LKKRSRTSDYSGEKKTRNVVLWSVDKLKACKAAFEIQRQYRAGDHRFKKFISHEFSLHISENKFL